MLPRESDGGWDGRSSLRIFLEMCVGQVSAEGSTCVERDVWQGTGTLYLYGKSRRRSGEDHNSVASETLPLPARTEMTAYLRCFRALVCNMRSALLPPASLTLLCRWRPFPCSARPSSSPRRGHGSKQRTPDRHRWGQSTTRAAVHPWLSKMMGCLILVQKPVQDQVGFEIGWGVDRLS